MTISIYDISVSVFAERLRALSSVLEKGEANAAERNIDPHVLLNARLAPDMFALTRQVQIATDHAKGATARLAGRDNPKYEDTEGSFAELQARIGKTQDFLASFTPSDLEGGATRIVELKLRQRDLSLPGLKYLLSFAMPNFYFHLTTAYDILRHNGVPLGKRDFLGAS